jgi:hypothetical protein
MIVYVFVSRSSVSFRITPLELHVLITILCYCHIKHFVLKTLWIVRGYVKLNAATVKEGTVNTPVISVCAVEYLV